MPLLTLIPILLALQGPSSLSVGRVTVVHWPGEERAARSLGEAADRSVQWPGIGDVPLPPITLVLAGSGARFDSLTEGRAPAWSGAVAFPASNTIVVKLQ